MKSVTGIFLLLLVAGFLRAQKDTSFHGYHAREFVFDGRTARIVFPDNASKERYWIWRARFWGHEPQVDKALLGKGFHLVYVDVAGFYGNDEAVKIWNKFYRYLRKKHRLNKNAVLEGMSRGGLIVYNWASKNTKKVACIYADAPVCDIKSWPGGMYNGTGSPEDWKACLTAYNLDEQSVLKFKKIPIFTCENIANANIPVIHVCGAADKVVPFAENSAVVAEQFEKAGNSMKLILKEGVGHHPHSLNDPTPIVEFIIDATVNKD